MNFNFPHVTSRYTTVLFFFFCCFLSSHHGNASYKIFFLKYLDIFSKSLNFPQVVDSVFLSLNHLLHSPFPSFLSFLQKVIFSKTFQCTVGGNYFIFINISKNFPRFRESWSQLIFSSVYLGNSVSLFLYKDKLHW